MLIDLITHTDLSPGGSLSARAIVERARAAGLDGVCIVDRERSRDALQWQALGAAHGVFVGVGVEVLCAEGLVVAFPPVVDEAFTQERWRVLTQFGRPTAQDVIDHFDALGGATILGPLYDHRQPFRLGDLAFALQRPNAIDVASPARLPLEDDLALEAATALDLPGVGASRALTRLEDVGRVATAFLYPVTSQADLVAHLRAGDAWAVRLRAPNDPAPARPAASREDHPQDDRRREDRPRDDRPRDAHRRDAPRSDRRRDDGDLGRPRDPETEQPLRRRRQFMLD
jgi:hypothetical protein